MKIGQNNIFSPLNGPSTHYPGAQPPVTPGPPSALEKLPTEKFEASPSPLPPASAWPPPELPSPTPATTPSLETKPLPAPPVKSPEIKAEKWMDSDWNLGPGSTPALKNPAGNVLPEDPADVMKDFWNYPQPGSNLHSKAVILDDQATYFVGGNGSQPKTKPESDPLLTSLVSIADKGLAKQNDPEMAAKFQKMMAACAGLVGGSMMGGVIGGMGSMLGMAGMAGMAGIMNPFTSGPLGGGTAHANNPGKWVGDKHEKLVSPPDASASEALAKLKAASNVAPAKPTEAVQPTREVPTCSGMTKTQVVAGVEKTLKSMGVQSAGFIVDEQLFPSLNKLEMNPVDFFTARACWQGVNTKRRALLEQVLDQFPTLPKDQKNWQAAVAALEAKGTKVSETDRFFVGYFIDNRKKMKSLFRATLPSGFEGKNAVCYRGQSSSSQFGPHSTKPLGCYSIDPTVSESWSSGNFKRFKVKLNDVWSTYTTLQNNHRDERELTVYSPGGIRRGETVKDSAAAKKEFRERYATDTLAKSLEENYQKTYF